MRVFGVLNVTPDSFSDGNQYVTTQDARSHAQFLRDSGADVIDVGGESTRPGATQVSAADEQRRVMPVINELVRDGFTVSVDTIRASTAERAVLAGAHIINDVSGGLFDDDMYGTVARLCANIPHVTYVIGHWRGFPDPDHSRSVYTDVVNDVVADLAARCDAAISAGVPAENIVVDPGLGFDKTAAQCWDVLRRISEIQKLGYPVMIGASRKRMLADITGAASQFSDRDLATAVVSTLAAQHGVWAVRVHDAAGTHQALKLLEAWQGSPEAQSPPTEARTPAVLDKVTLTGLECYAHHGVFDFEREHGQPFIIDAECHVDVSNSADDLQRTVHYGELAEAIVHAVQHDPVDLIETVAERAATVALGFAPVQEVAVTVHKPEAPIDVPFRDVSVTVTRRRAT